jgi:mono/diheme cytochrome c family protein
VFGLSIRRRIVLTLRKVNPIGQLMHMMIRNFFVCVVFTMAGNVSQVMSQPQEPYLPRPNYLARGDPAAGRRAYLALKCNTCHTVSGEPIGTRPPRLPGPQLGKSVALESPQQIADSIAAPGHAASQKSRPWHRSGLKMGDYTNIMTVRQFMDLVAYLRSN